MRFKVEAKDGLALRDKQLVCIRKQRESSLALYRLFRRTLHHTVFYIIQRKKLLRAFTTRSARTVITPFQYLRQRGSPFFHLRIDPQMQIADSNIVVQPALLGIIPTFLLPA